MKKFFHFLFLIWGLCFFSGCAGLLNPDYDPPVVSLRSFKMLQQESVTPGFEIGLHIINPNRDPLDLDGIYYTVAIEGYDVLAGVANNLPTVEAYGEADVLLRANVNLIKGIRLVSALMQDPGKSFKYSFAAKLDLGGFASSITVQEEGEFVFR